MKALVIGDPHIKHGSAVKDCEEYVRKIVAIATKCKPTFIVLLGDILDRHEVVHVQAHKIAEALLEGLSGVAHTYVLMGNHDYINNSQYLTDNHIFGPFKKWKNITIVDTVIGIYIEGRYIVFVPYVPPGRFTEALDTLIKDGETWELADCIFAHQEFKGCRPREKNGDFVSKKGDVWDEDYPLVVSGHIHKAQNVGENVKYPGNSLQHFYTENGNKNVWIMKWPKVNIDNIDDIDEYENTLAEPKITKISVGMKRKKTMVLTIDELKKKSDDILTECSKTDLNIKLIGTSAEFNNFRSGKLYNKLTGEGVVVSFELDNDADNAIVSNGVVIPKGNKEDRRELCYDRVFQDLIANKNDLIKKEYEELFGKLDVKIEVEGKDYIKIIIHDEITEPTENTSENDASES